MKIQPPSPAVQEALCVFLIVAAGAALWIPALNVVSLNPDESQYEATASYLVASGTSPFLPNGAPGTFGLWKLMTWIAGPYPIFEMRILVLASALAIALLLHLCVRGVADRWCGLLAGLLFLHWVQRFEGLVVNREWFASLFTMSGLALFLLVETRRPRRARMALTAAGFLCGMALWFKIQVGFMVLIAPVTMLASSARDRSMTRLVRDLPPFAAGGILSGLAYLAPFAWQGTALQFLRNVVFDAKVFVGGNEAAVQASSGNAVLMFFERFLLARPDRVLFLGAYVLAAAVVIAWTVARAKRDRPGWAWLTGPVPTLFTVYLALSMFSVQLGNRFFEHYYQLMLPAACASVGLAVHFFARIARDERVWQWFAVTPALLIVADRVPALLRNPLWAGVVRWPSVVLVVGLTIGLALVGSHWLRRPVRHAGVALALLLVLNGAIVIAREQMTPVPPSMSHNPHSFSELTRYMKSVSRPGDRLFVWGWAPEIYSLTRLEAASHITFCQYVANDLAGVPNRPALDREWAGLLMDELRRSRPRFIIDASRVSWYETEPSIYRLENFPDFELNDLLRREYRRVRRVDDCDVWERVGTGPTGDVEPRG